MNIKIYSKKHGDSIVEIDDEDWEKVKAHTWYMSYSGSALNPLRCPRIRSDEVVGGVRKVTYLTNLIVPYKRVVHIDGNFLNNKKENLRETKYGDRGRKSKNKISDISKVTEYWSKKWAAEKDKLAIKEKKDAWNALKFARMQGIMSREQIDAWDRIRLEKKQERINKKALKEATEEAAIWARIRKKYPD